MAKVGQELDIRKVASELATPRPFRKPQIVNRQLRKKEGIGLRGWVWVYNDTLTMAAAMTLGLTLGGLLAIVWGLLIPMIACIVGIVGSLIVLGLATNLALNRASGAEKFEHHLTHRGRRGVIEGERSRTHAPHAGSRKGRYHEAEFSYPQYSVLVGYTKESVELKLLIHKPWKDGRYYSAPFELSKEQWMELHPPKEKKDVENTIIPISDRQATKNFEHPFDLNEMLDTQREMEEMAELLEERAYQGQVKRLEVRRVALITRR